MLGELLLEGRWKVTGMRVLEDMKVEVTFQESSTILGAEFSGIATVTSWPMPGNEGTLYGESQAVLTTKDWDAVFWKGMGVDKPTGKMMGVT